MISYLDYISPEARAIGAVNVIRVTHKGNKLILRGYNSDVIGFTKSIEPLLERFHRKALILGTGSIESHQLRTEIARTGNGFRKPLQTAGDNTV